MGRSNIAQLRVGQFWMKKVGQFSVKINNLSCSTLNRQNTTRHGVFMRQERICRAKSLHSIMDSRLFTRWPVESHHGRRRLWSLVAWMFLVGCYPSVPIRVLTPPQASELTLLDYYHITVWGVADDSTTGGWFECRVNFLQSVPKSTPLDRIPILTIDTVCFEGACIGDRRCYKPLSSYEYNKALVLQGKWPYKSSFDSLPPDLAWNEEELLARGCVINYQPLLPLGCREDTLNVLIHARQNDRATGRLIRSEVKRMAVIVGRDKRVLYR